MHVTSFTHLVVSSLLLSLVAEGTSSAWFAVSCCLAAGVLTSFSAAVAVDARAYAKMRAKLGVGVVAFHAGHALLHAFPAAAALVALRPADARAWHGVAAAAAHACWSAVASRAAGAPLLCLDATYVPLRGGRASWARLHCVAWATEVGVALAWTARSAGEAGGGLAHEGGGGAVTT